MCINFCGYFLGNFWKILGYFIFQRLVTLFGAQKEQKMFVRSWIILIAIFSIGFLLAKMGHSWPLFSLVSKVMFINF